MYPKLAGLEFVILLPLPCKCWADSREILSDPACECLLVAIVCLSPLINISSVKADHNRTF